MREVITSTNLTAADAPLWNSPAHHGSVISIVTWILIIATVLAVIARVLTRYATINTLRWEDITAVFAMLTAIGQSVAVSISSTNGLGSHANSMNSEQIDVVQKALYASLLVYVVTLGFAKSSMCFHLYNLSPLQTSHRLSIVLGIIVGTWTVTAILVIAFQCKLPNPWSTSLSGKCIDLVAFWTYYGIVNIITDIAIIALPTMIVTRLQMKASRKAVIITCYCSRLSYVLPYFLLDPPMTHSAYSNILLHNVIIAQILQIVYYHTDVFQTQTSDLIYDLWIPTLLGQIIISFSLISSCFPYLKYLIDALETGMVRADGGNNRLTVVKLSSGGYYKAQGSSFRKGPFSSNSKSDGLGAASSASAWDRKKDASETAPEIEMQNLDAPSNKEADNTGRRGNRHGLQDGQFESMAYRGDDKDSQSSETHIIRKVEWSMTEENSGVAV